MSAEEPASTKSAIETASERLEAYLKTRESAEPRPSSDDLGSERDAGEPGGADTPVSTEPDVERRERRAPRWIKLALALAVLVAAAEGAYIAWRLTAPVAPRSETSAPSSPPVARPPSDATEAAAPPRTTDSVDSAADRPAPVETPATPATATTGSIEVRTTPPGATVVFGARRRGTTPLTIRDVVPGIHDLEVGGWFGSRNQRVRVRAGQTTQVELTVPPPSSR